MKLEIALAYSNYLRDGTHDRARALIRTAITLAEKCGYDRET